MMCERTPIRQSTVREIQNKSNMKSPSDTTVYAPGLRKLSERNSCGNCGMIDKISNFVESVRLEEMERVRHPTATLGVWWMALRNHNREPSGEDRSTKGNHEPPVAAEARARADKLILDAERFKASISAPQGNVYGNPLFVNQQNLPGGDGMNMFTNSQCNSLLEGDDDFFHLTCHIEPGLRSKIESGQFVDLEKLLPRDRIPHMSRDDNRMEMVNRDGATYFVPATDKDGKINNVKKWDQAFRVYAAIYCKCNPSRSAEIWQYIYVIYTAASTFQWENVAWYDYTFRQLMAAKPYRSWAKIYNQFSNLAMRNPVNNSSLYPMVNTVKEDRDRKSMVIGETIVVGPLTGLATVLGRTAILRTDVLIVVLSIMEGIPVVN